MKTNPVRASQNSRKCTGVSKFAGAALEVLVFLTLSRFGAGESVPRLGATFFGANKMTFGEFGIFADFQEFQYRFVL